MTPFNIWHLTVGNVGAGTAVAARTIATAFADLEMAEWLVPDPTVRVDVLAAHFAMSVKGALEQGEVLLGSCGPQGTVGIHGAAVWYHELTGPHSVPDDYDERLAQACGPDLDRFRLLDDAFATHHPERYPHRCLTHLAVIPGHQNHGLGSQLLRHTHRQVDIDRVPAYLVASNTRARELYARHGYERLGGPLQLPDDLQMWPMWREPQSPTDEAASTPSAPAEAES